MKKRAIYRGRDRFPVKSRRLPISRRCFRGRPDRKAQEDDPAAYLKGGSCRQDGLLQVSFPIYPELPLALIDASSPLNSTYFPPCLFLYLGLKSPHYELRTLSKRS